MLQSWQLVQRRNTGIKSSFGNYVKRPMGARKGDLMKRYLIVLSIVLILSIVFSSVAHAAKGGNSANAPGHNREPEADYGTGQGDDSTINKGRPSSDANNRDDVHTNGPNRPNAPSVRAGERANCDNNGFDCSLPETPDENGNGETETPKPPTKTGNGETETGETGKGETAETDRRVCWHSTGSVEVWDNLSSFGDESQIIGEAEDVFCWDAQIGATYYILIWTSANGHGGPQYSLTVTTAGSTIEVYNPFWGTLGGQGWTAKRLDTPKADLGEFEIR